MRLVSHLFSLFLFVAACSPVERATSQAPGAAPAPAEVRERLATEMTTSLQKELLDVWYPRVIDSTAGGYRATFDYRWNSVPPEEKMIVTQSRHVWTNAKVAGFFPERPGHLEMAAHGFAFLRDAMWDDEYGGFFWLVSRDGEPVAEPGGPMVKQAYGNAFGIYALAAYYAASKDTAALHLAQRAFRWLDANAHDPQHRGYFNYLERDGTPMRDGFRGTPPKDQNSSIHILEAFTELYHVWPDPVLRDRLQEMLLLIRDTIRVDPGYLTLFSTAEWKPISYRDSSAAAQEAHRVLDHVSFGHDVETAFLMLEAAEALGIPNDPATLRAGKQMVDHALKNGYDNAVGGFYDEGYYFKDRPGLTIVLDTKNWWAQAEGLNTLLLLSRYYPDDPNQYYQKFEQMWSYVKTNLIDHEYGGWYEGGLDKQPRMKQARKAHIWKASYHDGRALMNCIRQLRATDARH